MEYRRGREGGDLLSVRRAAARNAREKSIEGARISGRADERYAIHHFVSSVRLSRRVRRAISATRENSRSPFRPRLSIPFLIPPSSAARCVNARYAGAIIARRAIIDRPRNTGGAKLLSFLRNDGNRRLDMKEKK